VPERKKKARVMTPYGMGLCENIVPGTISEVAVVSFVFFWGGERGRA
jgi:hypothetical protein